MKNGEVEIVGIHPIESEELQGTETCYLIEIIIQCSYEEFDFEKVTQEEPELPEGFWQVAWDERELMRDGDGTHCAFFMHCLDLSRPIITPLGKVHLPSLTPIPVHLEGIEYNSPH